MKFIYFIFCSFDSRDQWTLTLKKFYWPLLYCRNQREKNFFFYKIFRPIIIGEKIEYHYSIFYSLESRDQWPLMLKKFYWRLLYCRNSGEKIFFFPQNFSTNQNWRKNRIPLFDFLLIGIERPMNTDTKKILLTFVVLSKSARKNFFFSSKFFDQSQFEINEIHLFYFLLVRFERPMNTDAKKILLTFVVLSKSARKKFFFLQNFSTNQNWRKNRIPLIRETNEHLFRFFFFSTNQNSRDQWTLMLKKFYWPLLYCRNQREKNFFFFTKFFDQSELEKKSNSIIRFFTHWNRETNEHWY